MGGNPTKPDRKDLQKSSSSSERLSYIEIFSKLEQKESIFKTIEAEIDVVKQMVTNDRKYLKWLVSELAEHIRDLNQLKRNKLDRDDETRRLVITKKYELALGKLKSILSKPEITDLVTDTNHIEPDSPTAPKNLEDEELCWVKNQYDALWDQIESPQMSLKDYCQIYRDLFCLQERLRNFRITPKSPLFDINNKVNNLKDVVNKKIKDLEPFDHFAQILDIIKRLELRVAIEDDNKENLTQLEDVAYILQKDLQETTWEDRLMGKNVDLLISLNKVMVTLNISVYYNLLKHMHEEIDCSNSDSIFEDCKEEDLYGIMDVMKQYCPDKVHNYLDIVTLLLHFLVRKNFTSKANRFNPRGNVNNDMLQISGHVPSLTRISSESKRSKPLPRRNPGEGDSRPRIQDSNQEKVIQDLPKYWNRLDEILHKEFATTDGRLEVLLIRNWALETKVLLEKRLADIAKKF